MVCWICAWRKKKIYILFFRQPFLFSLISALGFYRWLDPKMKTRYWMPSRLTQSFALSLPTEPSISCLTLQGYNTAASCFAPCRYDEFHSIGVNKRCNVFIVSLCDIGLHNTCKFIIIAISACTVCILQRTVVSYY